MGADLIFPGLRALIVEDETLIAEELRERLSRLGFTIIAAVDSAEEGIAIAREMLIAVRGMVQGAQISAPSGRYTAAADVLEALGT